jgi:hypothetical protein
MSFNKEMKNAAVNETEKENENLNTSLTVNNVRGLYKVNTNKVKNNFNRYGMGNRNVSPNITSPRLNNLPSIGPMPTENNDYNVPRPVPRMMLPMPVRNNNAPPAKRIKLKQNRKSRRNRKANRKTRKN